MESVLTIKMRFETLKLLPVIKNCIVQIQVLWTVALLKIKHCYTLPIRSFNHFQLYTFKHPKCGNQWEEPRSCPRNIK